jgi:hypothetical protein
MRNSGAAALALLVPTLALLVAGLTTPARANGLNNLAAGFNGLLTAPADPVMGAVEPIEAFEDIWAGPATAHFMGLFQGTLLMSYRVLAGVFDIAFAPFWVFPTLSPEARYDVIPGYEIEYE